MNPLTPQQEKKLRLLADILDDGEVTIAKEIGEIDERLEDIEEKIENIKLQKGDKGDTPIAGIDFEIPKDGKDYILTEKDKSDIAKKIKVPIVEKVIEKTEVIVEKPLVTEITKVEKIENSDTGEQIVDKINALPTDDSDKKIGIEHIKGLKKELETIGTLAMNRGQTIVTGSPTRITAGSNITVTSDGNSGYIISSTGGGGGEWLVPTGTVDGSNAVFAVASEPTMVMTERGASVAGFGYTYSAPNITLDVPPQDFIRYM